MSVTCDLDSGNHILTAAKEIKGGDSLRYYIELRVSNNIWASNLSGSILV